MSEFKVGSAPLYQPAVSAAKAIPQTSTSAAPVPVSEPGSHEADHFGPPHHSAGSALPAVSLASSPPQLASASPAQIQQAVDEAISSSYAKVPPRAGESRHDLNRRIQSQPLSSTDGASASPGKNVHYDGSELVVIAFEGTGAFDARQAPIMQDAARRLQQQGLSSQGALYGAVTSGLTVKEGKATNWSGLAAGPLESLLQDPGLDKHTQWLSFPSEEFEALSHPSAIQNTSLKQLLREAVGSNIGETPGINDALIAMIEIQAQARAQGKDPKFAIVTHSSGGRSAVKFLEKAKILKDEQGAPLKFPFAMTIDPVREAHEALGEAAKELINKGTEHNVNRLRGLLDALPLVEVEQHKVYPPLVRHRSQPESLYAPSNVSKFISFYQQKDTEGLKMEPRFGIQGSPVAGAINQEVKDVGTAGHGEIAYNPLVTSTFTQELKKLLKP